MASADEIYLTVKGQGGHAALPEETSDTVHAASKIIVEIKALVDREKKEGVPTILSFGKVIAQGATNVIPSRVEIAGTFRTFNEEWRAEAHEKINLLAKRIASSFGAECDVNIVKGYPYMQNNEEVTRHAKAFATDYLGEENIIDMDIRMTADDFAFFSQQYPATYYRLGIKPKHAQKETGLHTPDFMPDEEALKTGAGLMAWLCFRFCTR
jgi:amidohydrolase